MSMTDRTYTSNEGWYTPTTHKCNNRPVYSNDLSDTTYYIYYLPAETYADDNMWVLSDVICSTSGKSANIYAYNNTH